MSGSKSCAALFCGCQGSETKSSWWQSKHSTNCAISPASQSLSLHIYHVSSWYEIRINSHFCLACTHYYKCFPCHEILFGNIFNVLLTIVGFYTNIFNILLSLLGYYVKKLLFAFISMLLQSVGHASQHGNYEWGTTQNCKLDLKV